MCARNTVGRSKSFRLRTQNSLAAWRCEQMLCVPSMTVATTCLLCECCVVLLSAVWHCWVLCGTGTITKTGWRPKQEASGGELRRTWSFDEHAPVRQVPHRKKPGMCGCLIRPALGGASVGDTFQVWRNRNLILLLRIGGQKRYPSVSIV